MAPRVSIVIPTLSRPQLLRHAIDSVLAQTCAEWELIVVDEGGLPETAAVLADRADPRISFHQQAGRVGIVENWGTGVRLARGEYVTILSDDDRLGVSFVAARIAALDDHPDALVAFSPFDVRTPHGDLLRVQGCRRPGAAVLDGEALLDEALSRRWFIGASMYRRDCLEILWPHLAQDALVLDLALDVRLAMLPDARGVALPRPDFVMLAHPEQSSEARRDEVRVQTVATLVRLERAAKTRRQRRSLRRARSNWLVVWARDAAAGRALAQTWLLLLRALRAAPSNGWAWRQFAVALIFPHRLGR